MKKKNLTIVNAGVAFLVAFIFSQLTLAIGTSITKTIMLSIGRSSAQIDTFFETSVGYLLKSIYLNIAFIGVFMWHFKSLDKHDLMAKPNKATAKYSIYCIIFGIISFFLLSGIINYFQWFVFKLGYNADSGTIAINSTKDLLISLVSLAVLPAICEELLFRGVILNCLKSKGTIFAIVLSSIMFAIFHLSPLQLIYPICWGLLLGIVYLRTKNILFTIIMHFINNAFSLCIQYFTTSTGSFNPSTFMTIYTIVTFSIWVLAMAYLFRDLIRHNKETATNTNNANTESKSTTDLIDNSNSNTTKNKGSDIHNNLLFSACIAVMVFIYILLLFA